MQLWREIHLKYPTLEDFKNKGSNEFSTFIQKREEKYVGINLVEAPKTGKKQKITKDNKGDVQVNVVQNQELEVYSLDRVWKPIINSNPALSNDQNTEIMKKLELYYNKAPLCILYGDDLLGTPMMINSNTNKLINKAISLRHDGFTFLLGIQAWTGGLPKTIRMNGKVFAMFQTADDKLLKSFYDETMSSVCSFQDFKLFFNNVIDGKTHKFLLVDRITLPIHLRLNWNIIAEAKSMLKQWLPHIKEPIEEEKEQEKQRKKIIVKPKQNFIQDWVDDFQIKIPRRKRIYEEEYDADDY